MNTIERVLALRDAGEVRRLHTIRTIRTHTIAEHTYGAMCIGLELCRLNDQKPERVLITLLQHDVTELETGDVPAPVKRAEVVVKEAFDRLETSAAARMGLYPVAPLEELEEAIAKAADCLDLGFACLYERQLGNHSPRLELCFENILDYTRAQTWVAGVDELREQLVLEWSQLP